jgi:hypothetical protein
MLVVTPDLELNDLHIGEIHYQGMLAQYTLPDKRPRRTQESAPVPKDRNRPESRPRKQTL